MKDDLTTRSTTEEKLKSEECLNISKREINNEIKTILSSPPQNRTREGIKLATLSLRTAVDTFAEYPIHMQEKLAQVGWYERVIIREGHVPQNFYLILSGTALVTKTSINRQTGEPFVRTAAFLKEGKTFGDFINMFMSHEANEEQNFITFLRKIEVLSGWPVENLPDNKPGICIHIFFR
ncbi:UNVERIFIED_CONTAM: hypothetical protein FKN15_015841 [Acipenser sinensis]